MKNIAITLLIMVSYLLNAQEELGYQIPKKELLDLIDVDLAPTVLRNTKNTVMVLLSRSTYKSIADLSRKELRIAGLRVDPKRFIGSRTTYYNKVELVDFEKGKTRLLVAGLPNKPQLTNFIWSPDEKMIAMTHTSDSSVELWILDVTTRKAKKLSSQPINATMGNSINWFKSSKELLVKLIPKDREDIIDQSVVVPTGPKVTENNGEKAQNRTYQDLIKNPTDAKNFTQLSRSEIYKIDLNGNTSHFLEARMYRGVSVSYIDATRDNLEMKATEMSTTELAEELGLEVDALSEKAFGDTPGTHDAPNEILFTGYDIFTFDELVDMYVTAQFDGLARQC